MLRTTTRAYALALLVCAALPLFARGGKEQPLEPASGLENWERGFDISAYPKGKYNIVIEGRDAAGNIVVAGPINVYVDPNSDLPLVSLVNPRPFMRVGGDLLAVGTAKDDDGVERVEVSIDGGEWQRAEGTEFWTLGIDTKALADGRRRIVARAVDINGLAGPEVRIQFDLDRARPQASLGSPAAGALVAGQVRLEGSVADANGLRSLEISTDGGKTFVPVDLKRSKDPTTASFSFGVDSRKFPDGPLVVWMRSVDGVGSQGSAAFLLVVDNTKPLIEVSRPSAGQTVNGRFYVAGAVRDAVGIASFSYAFGAETGQIELAPGNPFFVREFDALPVKGDKAEVILTAVDRIGNQTRLVVAPKIDREADKPRLSLDFPTPGAVAKPAELLRGSILDDDGVAALRYSFDGAPPTELPVVEAFSFPFPALASGKHKLSLWAVDRFDTPGNPVAVEFSLDLGTPSIALERLTRSTGNQPPDSRPFRQGLEFRVDGGEFLEGAIRSPNPLVGAEYAISGGSRRKIELLKGNDAASFRFRLPLDRSLPYGFGRIELEVKDSFGNLGKAEALVYAVDYASIREDPGFVFDDPRIGPEGAVAISAAEPLRGAFYREELSSLRFEPPTELVEASFSGTQVTIAPKREGRSSPVRLIGTTKQGREYSAGPFVFSTDSTLPRVSVSSPVEGAFVRERLRVEGRIEDHGGLSALAWRAGTSGETRSVRIAQDGSFTFDINPPDLAAGPFLLVLEARDECGNVGRAARGVFVDAAPPELRFLSPPSDSTVRGPEDVAALLTDPSGIASVEYSEDGANFAAIPFASAYFVHRADLAANPRAAYRVRDRAGNETIARPAVKAAPLVPPIPAAGTLAVAPAEGELKVDLAGAAGARKLSLSLPALPEAAFSELGFAQGEAVPERFGTRFLLSGLAVLKGQVSGTAALRAVSYSADGGASFQALASFKDEKSAKPILPFALSIDCARVPDGEARFLLKVEDFAGGVFFAPLFAVIDNAPPQAAILYPESGSAIAPGPIPLVVAVSDNRALLSAELTVGAERTALAIQEGGSYFVRVLDSSASKGSSLVGTLSVRDEAGAVAAAAFKANYDAAADLPLLSLELPSGPLDPALLVAASAKDDDGPPVLELSVDGAAVVETVRSEAGLAAIELAGLAPGKHSLLATASDAQGKKSELRRDFVVLGPAPALKDIAIGPAGKALPWIPGIAVDLGPALFLSGAVEAPNGLASLEIAINGAPAIKAALGKAAAPGASIPFSAPLPAALPYKRVSADFVAKDLLGAETRRRYDFHPLLQPLPGTPPAEIAEGIRFSDSRIESREGAYSILLKPGDAIEGRLNGRPIASLELVPTNAAMAASYEGAELRLEAKGESLVPSLLLKATTVDGDRFDWGPFSLRVDAAPPEIRLDTPAELAWVGNSITLSGVVLDANGVESLGAALEGSGAVLPVPLQGSGPGERRFNVQLPLDSAPDGTLRIALSAKDGAGRETRYVRTILKDTVAPEIVQVVPAPGEGVNGTTTVVAEVRDAGRIESRSFHTAPNAEAAEIAGEASVSLTLDLARLSLPLPEGAGFLAADRSGNRTVLAPELRVDLEADKPRVDIQAPAELEVLRADFAISGAAFDDDGVAEVYVRIDSGEWSQLKMEGAGFHLPIALAETTDNEHLVEAYAVDLFGVKGEVASRRYRISKEEPIARMTGPSIAKPHRGLVELEGTAADANGIAGISVSFDNVTTYVEGSGAEAWRYPLDTRILADGLHPISVRPEDKYDTTGFSASLITVDNTAPQVALDLPGDGASVARSLLVSGRVSDNLALQEVRLEVLPAGAKGAPALSEKLGTGTVVRTSLDIASLEPGIYTVRLIARDRAENETLASRDVRVIGAAPPDTLDVFFPVEGAALAGRVDVVGRASVVGGAGAIEILVDGERVADGKADENGNFTIEIPADGLTDGAHRVLVRTLAPDGTLVKAREVSIAFSSFGPYVRVESPVAGAYLPYRPFLEGRAGWALPPAEPYADKAVAKTAKAEAAGRKVEAVEVSLDNGRSFLPAEGQEKWRFRLETQDYQEGPLHLIVRARYSNGASASIAALYALDKTPPEVKIVEPAENGRFNGEIRVAGYAADESGLAMVGAAIREGDKKSYELPAFIQGLYVDAHFLGANFYEGGLGLTFFQDNVKLQGYFGQAPEDGRFGGTVYGAKLIANLAYLPASYFFGPDWDFLSAAFGLGASFSYFSTSTSGQGLVLGAVIAQIEFPKFTFSKLSAFRKYSIYTEGQAWFVSSDVQGGIIYRLAFGVRLGIF